MKKEQVVNRLDTESVGKSFVRYLIPSMVGMLLMAINIVVDGIMVGNRLGPVALAGVRYCSARLYNFCRDVTVDWNRCSDPLFRNDGC